jgi:hypothetical protein
MSLQVIDGNTKMEAENVLVFQHSKQFGLPQSKSSKLYPSQVC